MFIAVFFLLQNLRHIYLHPSAVLSIWSTGRRFLWWVGISPRPSYTVRRPQRPRIRRETTRTVYLPSSGRKENNKRQNLQKPKTIITRGFGKMIDRKRPERRLLVLGSVRTRAVCQVVRRTTINSNNIIVVLFRGLCEPTFVQQQPKKKTETFGYCVSCVYFLAYCFDSRRLYVIIVFCVGNNHERRLTVRSEEFESRASGADFYSDGRRAPRGCEWVYCKVCDE